MDHIIWVIQFLDEMLVSHGELTSLIGTFLLGENAAIAIFALSAQGYIHPVNALIFVFFGSMLADIFWFFMTEYVIRHHYEKRITKSMQSDDKRFIISLVDKHFFWVLIFIKFLMGMRLVLTIYIVLKNRIPFFQKVLIDAVGTVLFLAVLFPIGWLFGKGVSSALSLEQNILTILSAVVFIILFVSLAPKIFIFVLKKIFKYKKSPLSTTV